MLGHSAISETPLLAGVGEGEVTPEPTPTTFQATYSRTTEVDAAWDKCN